MPHEWDEAPAPSRFFLEEAFRARMNGDVERFDGELLEGF